MLDCAKKTVSKNGPLGLYRGALPLIIGSSGKQAARWTGYQTVLDQFKDGNGNVSGLGPRIVAGACGGVTEAIF